ncbi:GNAT family N-acetyltransferase [Spirosoma soli]|uniref:GNAT family N-acetyltransferase n=1 Tax=Spirosoma soli TaxID=1770529 RepID=A0ABW5M1F1_9BACT
MTQYRILHQQHPSADAIPAYFERGFFFNEETHLRQQHNGCFHLITAVNCSTRLAEARCAFFVQSTEAVSPTAAPFGSIEFAESLPDSVLNKFVQTLTQTATATGAIILRLINYPHCYAPQQANRLIKLLVQQGFNLTRSYANAYLPVTSTPYDEVLIAAERRRLRKCQQAGFVFRQWMDPDIDAVISFISDILHARNYPLSISTARLADLLKRFPDEFRVFVVNHGLVITALSVVVRVREDILYNFLPASNPDYNTFSPMVMLVNGLYTYCQQQGIRLLDLGVSLDGNHQPKPSLMRFKRNLGAQESSKLTFEKQL